MCACVRVCVCVRACVHACVRACVQVCRSRTSQPSSCLGPRGGLGPQTTTGNNSFMSDATNWNNPFMTLMQMTWHLGSIHLYTFPDHVATCPLDMLNYTYCEKLLDLYSNLIIALRILLILPVSVASGERSFEALRGHRGPREAHRTNTFLFLFFYFFYLYWKYYMGHFCGLKVSSLGVTYLKAQPKIHFYLWEICFLPPESGSQTPSEIRYLVTVWWTGTTHL